VKSFRLLRVVKIALLVAAVLALAGFVVMSLWNWLVPALFGGPALHFWQAIGLLALTRILFGRIGRGQGQWAWRGRMRQDWQRLTPEEREKLRENLYRRCGARSTPASEPKA
jgi:hypothetical protein